MSLPGREDLWQNGGSSKLIKLWVLESLGYEASCGGTVTYVLPYLLAGSRINFERYETQIMGLEEHADIVEAYKS